MNRTLQDMSGRVAPFGSPDGIAPREAVRFETAPLIRLFTDLGEDVAEDRVGDVLSDLTRRLRRLENAYHLHEVDLMPAAAREIAAVAESIGLASVIEVALTVVETAGGHDGAALGATMARLSRVMERSLVDIWDVGAR